VIELLLERLDAHREVRVAPAECAGLDPGACGRIEWGGQNVGFVGNVARAICDKLDLRHVPVAAELELQPLLDGAQHVPQLTPLPRFPAVRRDLTLDIAESTRFDALRRMIQQVNPANLEAIEYVGSYRGKQVKAGQKSVTLSLVFRSQGQTLTSQSVDEAMKQIVQAAAGAGASLRG
jgi:phenylalanyl-tRNA synthetase beta chain